MDIVELSRTAALPKLNDKSAVLVEIPIGKNKNDVNAKAVFLNEEKKYAPFVACDFCKKLFVWFKFVNGTYINQSGVSTVKNHQASTCPARPKAKTDVKSSSGTENNQNQLLITRMMGASRPPHSRKQLPTSEKTKWRNEVVKTLSEHPTVSINACANLASNFATYASEVDFRTNDLHDWRIGRTFISKGK